MSEFYEIDSTRVSLREYWWGSKTPLVVLGWIIKWLRIRIPSSSDDPNTASTIPFLVDGLPPEVEVSFQPFASDLAALGFQSPIFHLIYDSGTRTTIYWATFVHASGRHFARIHLRLWQQAQKPTRGLFPMFFTEFTDGTFLVSSAGKPDMAAPPTVQMNRMRGAKTIDLWNAHERQVQSLTERKMISPVLTREDLVAASERHHGLMRDFHLARGVFRLRTAAEQIKAEAFATNVDQARARGEENAEILAEIARLQEKKSGVRSLIWLLVGSLLGFMAAGAAQWDWKFTLWIIPVLFFHELGHWVAMRIFRYRNLKMFFIPFFGAAVMGQNWNVPGWKKALVSLAGPLPGIAVGLVLGLASLVFHKPWMTSAAMVLLILNGLNLLPILPLDGGHVLQATLFCRNRWLDGAFRIVAIIGLILFGIFGGGRLLAYVAIPMAIALPVVFRLGKVTDDLRRVPLPPPAPGQDNIPAPTAQAIISAIRGAFPAKVKLSDKMVAQHTLSIFENLNARPPNVPATLGILALHAGAIFVCALIGGLLVVNKQGGLGDFVKAAARQPQHQVECGAIQRHSATEEQGSARNVLITTFKNRDLAKTAFSGLTNQIPTNAGLTLFGDTLLLSLPVEDDAAREYWFENLQERSTNGFVAFSNAPVMMTMTFLAPTASAATNLTRELKTYLEATSGMHLIAPWSPEATGARYAGFRKSREGWQTLRQEVSRVWRDPSLKSYQARLSAAIKRGAMGEVTRLEKEHAEKIQELEEQAGNRLRTNSAAGIDAELIDLNSRLRHINPTNRTAHKQVYREIAAKLGEISYEGGVPSPAAKAYGVASGMVAHHSLLVEMQWIYFNDPTKGLPAFLDWICAAGARQVRYDFEESDAGDRMDEEDP